MSADSVRFRPFTRWTDVQVGILRAVEQLALPDEPLFEAAARLMLNEALADAEGCQALAATRLRVSRREINYRAAKYHARPKDKRLA